MPEPVKIPVSMPLSTPGPMNMEMPRTIRKRFIAKGRVQRAGYRAFILAFADANNLKGFTRNLPDRTVEIVCEGTPGGIEAFLKSIDRKGDPQNPLSINVMAITETPPQPGGELKDFYIDYGRELTPIERESMDRDEMMVMGAGMLNMKVDDVGNAVKDVGQKVGGLGEKMDCVGQKVDGVGQKVDSMHMDMNTRFDHMAERYDLIAASLVKAIEKMDHGFEKMDKNAMRMEKVMEQSRREAAASNRELAKAVNFMIRKLSNRPIPRKTSGKKKR